MLYFAGNRDFGKEDPPGGEKNFFFGGEGGTKFSGSRNIWFKKRGSKIFVGHTRVGQPLPLLHFLGRNKLSVVRKKTETGLGPLRENINKPRGG